MRVRRRFVAGPGAVEVRRGRRDEGGPARAGHEAGGAPASAPVPPTEDLPAAVGGAAGVVGGGAAGDTVFSFGAMASVIDPSA